MVLGPAIDLSTAHIWLSIQIKQLSLHRKGGLYWPMLVLHWTMLTPLQAMLAQWWDDISCYWPPSMLLGTSTKKKWNHTLQGALRLVFSVQGIVCKGKEKKCKKKKKSTISVRIHWKHSRGKLRIIKVKVMQVRDKEGAFMLVVIGIISVCTN